MFEDNIIYNRESRIQYQMQKIRRITSQFPLLLEKRKKLMLWNKTEFIIFCGGKDESYDRYC